MFEHLVAASVEEEDGEKHSQESPEVLERVIKVSSNLERESESDEPRGIQAHKIAVFSDSLIPGLAGSSRRRCASLARPESADP